MNLIILILALVAVIVLTGFECYREEQKYKRQMELLKKIQFECWETKILCNELLYQISEIHKILKKNNNDKVI